MVCIQFYSIKTASHIHLGQHVQRKGASDLESYMDHFAFPRRSGEKFSKLYVIKRQMDGKIQIFTIFPESVQ